MMNMANKKEYSKPTVKAVRWNMKEALCDNVYVNSLCIKVVDDDNENIRIDHRLSRDEGGIQWNEWPSR